MSTEKKAKIERLASLYENRILVVTVVVAVIACACLSLYVMNMVSWDTFNPLKGDRAVVTYESSFNDKTVTQVAVWVDQQGIKHYATETPKLAGIDEPVLVLIMISLGLAKAGYDIYRFLVKRYRRRLMARFH
jgi:hypothetical protein